MHTKKDGWNESKLKDLKFEYTKCTWKTMDKINLKGNKIQLMKYKVLQHLILYIRAQI